MRIDEFAGILSMPVEDMVKIGEKQASNPNSQIYKSLKLEVGKKISAIKAASEVDKKKKMRNRVYIQHVVSTEDRYTFTTAFPNWDLKFANSGLRSASTALGIYTLMTEYLFEKVKTSRGKVIAWGVDMRSIVMRSREWVHLCVPGHELSAQSEFLAQDRSILAMVNASVSRGRDPGLAKRYAVQQTRLHCTAPATCTHEATAGIMMLHRTDTNFRQIAMYMRQHGLRLLYYVIPGGKHLELGTQGEIPHLGAYAHPSKDGHRIDVVYKDDLTLTQSYTYANYLELVARTEVRIGNMVFRKEIDNNILGTLCYKVTCFPDSPGLLPSPTTYRSWIEPDHAKQYMVYAPVLRSDGDFSNPEHFEMTSFPVPFEVIDDVHDHAMRAQGVKDILSVISSRLNSKTSTQILLYQIVQRNKLLAVSRFDLLVFVIFCSVFMQKYTDGQTMTTLAPHARELADLAKHGTLGMMSAYARALFSMSTSGLSQFISSLRKFYYEVDSYSDLPLPSFLIEPGFVKYADDASSNPRFKSWNTPDGNPTFGFSQSLPGSAFVRILPFDEQSVKPFDDNFSDGSITIDPMLLASGEMVVNSQVALDLSTRTKIKSRDVQICKDSGAAYSWFSSMASYVANALESFPDSEQVASSVTDVQTISTDVDPYYEPTMRIDSTRVYDKDMLSRPMLFTQAVDDVVNKVLNDNNRLANVESYKTTTHVFSVGDIPTVIPGSYSHDPIEDIRDALGMIFPKSQIMNTQFFESDKNYGDFDFLLKGNKIKIDLSKLNSLKPERFYPPILSGHVQPDVKNTTGNTLHMLQKRNANTPDSAIPMDEQRVIDSAFASYLAVFCKEGTEQVLEDLPYIGPDDVAVREWVSRLPEVKRTKLENQDGYSTDSLDLQRNTMHLKNKLKISLNASYSTSVKAPQGIQFDPTGKSTATLSGVIGRKVEREQTVLKHNVLVLQRKSVDDIVRFLNGFDHRPDARGSRMYIEADYEAFDRSQGPLASKMHWHKCAKFGVMPHLVKFLVEHNQVRSVSALEAGIKMFLDVQRGSGHPDTLDGNNDVNEMVLSELLLTMIDQIEFIILQGDDVIVAIRGAIQNITNWEYEISRRFNLVVKFSIQEHGYICSYDIVHLPDGHTVVVADVVKRALNFLSMNKRDEETFAEQFISFADNMRYIDDIRVQRYLADVLPKRMKSYLPGTTSEAILLLCKACSRLKTDYAAFRKMFSDTTRLVHH